jgi:hypothetical protein
LVNYVCMYLFLQRIPPQSVKEKARPLIWDSDTTTINIDQGSVSRVRLNELRVVID